MCEEREYDCILSQFNLYLSALQKHNTAGLENVFLSRVKVYLSTVKDFSDGSQHGLTGICNFIMDQPETDFYHLRLCNPILHVKSESASMTAIVVAHTYRGDEENFCYFDYTADYAITWQKFGDQWMVTEMRMDLVEHSGNDTEFEKNWYYEKSEVAWYQDMHLPCINGYLDNPWHKIPNDETNLSEEEKIMETMYTYAAGVDYGSFDNHEHILDDSILVDMQPWGIMGKRLFMSNLQFIRSCVRYSAHPFIKESVRIKGDFASLRLWRLTGQPQKHYPVIYSYENRNHEYSSACYYLELKKEEGQWKVCKLLYQVEITDLGLFDQNECKEEKQ
jgi:hypothetical protein